MVQSKIRPIIVRLKKMRLRYSLQDMSLGEFYSVICYDMKRLIVTNEKADRSFYIKWDDAELYRSEYVASQSTPSLSAGDIQALRRTMKRLADAIPSVSK